MTDSLHVLPKAAWMAKLPAVVKRLASRLFWLLYDARDWLAEAIGWLPSNRMRCFMWRRLGTQIGKRTSIHRNCRLYRPSRYRSNHCVILHETLLDGRKGVAIIQRQHLLRACSFFLHRRRAARRSTSQVGSMYRRRVHRCTGHHLPGLHGRGAVVAGAVVTRIFHLAIVGGVPADKLAPAQTC
jgi:hypothetical protein